MKKNNKYKAHTVYKNPETGKIIPGVTTILGIKNKPQLIKWANNLGLQGIDSSKYVDDMAAIGTLAHKMVEHDCDPSIEINFEDYSKNQIDLAENSFLKWLEWKNNNDFEPIENEIKLVGKVDNDHYYGGTVDIYCKLNGKFTLMDIKTCKAIYPDHFIQVAAYKNAMVQNSYTVEDVRIFRMGRDENENWEERKVTNLDKHTQIFMNLVEIYYIDKELKQ